MMQNWPLSLWTEEICAVSLSALAWPMMCVIHLYCLANGLADIRASAPVPIISAVTTITAVIATKIEVTDMSVTEMSVTGTKSHAVTVRHPHGVTAPRRAVIMMTGGVRGMIPMKGAETTEGVMIVTRALTTGRAGPTETRVGLVKAKADVEGVWRRRTKNEFWRLKEMGYLLELS